MKNMMVLRSLILFSALVLTGCIKTEKVDLVIHNAKIYAVDGTSSTFEAMAIKDGRIVELGAERQIMNKYGADEFMDAAKKPIYPGFIDAHCHFWGYSRSLNQVNLVGTKSFDAVLEKVEEHAKKVKTKWITGRGWDQNDWEVQEFPDREKLDALFPERPVLIRRVDGHGALANLAALNAAGLTVDSQIEGGIVEVKNGRLTGILIDNAVDLVLDVIPSESKEEMTQSLLQAQANCFEVGLTTLDDAGLNVSDISLLQELQESGDLKMRLYVMVSDKPENLEHYLTAGPIKTERLSVRSFKFYVDGALGSRGACMLEPYSDLDSSHHGLILTPEQHFRDAFGKLKAKGFQINSHCIGDSANRLMLNLYGEFLGGSNDLRWRIEHSQVISEEDFAKFAEFNIIPSVQPTHATSDMYWAAERVGAERIKGAYAYKRLMEQNGLLPLGTDFPVEGISPIHTFYAAVVRKDHKGFPEEGYQMENALSRKEALMGITIWGAISNFEEMNKGTLEPGKFADFVVLDRDILKVPEDKILGTETVATFVNGELVYGKLH